MDEFADVYLASNTKARPGTGRGYDGSLSYNRFAIRLSREENGAYEPYTLGRLIQELNEHLDHRAVCARCVFGEPLVRRLAGWASRSTSPKPSPS